MDEHGEHRVGRHAAGASRRDEHPVEPTVQARTAGTSGGRHASRTPAASARRGAVPDEGSHARRTAAAESQRPETHPSESGFTPEGKPAPSAVGNNPCRKGAPSAGGNKSRKRRKGVRLTTLGWAAVGAVGLIAVVAVIMLLPRGDDNSQLRVTDAATLPPDDTAIPTALPADYGIPDAGSTDGSDGAVATDELSPDVEPIAEPAWSPKPMGEIVPEADPGLEEYGYEYRIVADGDVVDSYAREKPIAMGRGSDYSELEGVLCFRGNNYRDTAAWGTVPNDASGLEIVWTKKIGGIDTWYGVG